MKLINVGLCSFGMSGKVFHAPFINEHPGFHLAGIVERTKNLSEKFYPNATIYRSIEELLEDESVEIVVVNTPVQTHYNYAKAALMKGKNVIVEKPFTINAQQAIELCEIAENQNVFISVYQNRRFDRDYLQVKSIVEEGLLGDIKDAEIRFDRFRTSPSGKDHKEDPTLSGSGTLHDLGAHLIDQAIQLFGVPNQLFADVFTMKDEEVANDYFDILLMYASKLRVHLKASVFVANDYYAYKIFGTEGSFLQERSDSQEAELVQGVKPTFNADWIETPIQEDGILTLVEEGSKHIKNVTSSPSSYMVYYQQIYEHLVFGYPLPSAGKEVIETMKVIDACLESAKFHKIIKL